MEAAHPIEDAVGPAGRGAARPEVLNPLDNKVVVLRPAGLSWCVTAPAPASAPLLFNSRREAGDAALALVRHLNFHGFAIWLETYDCSHDLVTRVLHAPESEARMRQAQPTPSPRVISLHDITDLGD